MTAIDDERARRLHLWQQIAAADIVNIEPETLRSLLIYGGAQDGRVGARKDDREDTARTTTLPISSDLKIWLQVCGLQYLASQIDESCAHLWESR
jgi:hypothetical protein